MPLDPYIARGVQPIDVTNAMYQGANLQMEQQRANAFDERNALLDRRWEQESQREQEAAAKEERKRRKEAAGPLLYRAIQDGNKQAMDIAYEFTVEDFPELGNMPRELADQAILQGLEKSYGEQLKPNPTRTRVSGGYEVQEEFDPKTGKWSEIGRGSRWAPQQAPQPSAEERDRQWYLNATEEQRALYDRMKGRTNNDGATMGQTQRRANDAENVRAAITEAKALVGPISAGFVGQKTREQGGTPAFDLNSKIDTIKANIGFDRLQRMREESKTGGALGQVAVQELTMLQSTITSLDTAQSPKQLMQALDRVDAQYKKAMDAYDAAMREAGKTPNQAGGREVDFSQLPPGR